ncbi:MAG: hypothetical protein U0802_09630 [Candidatus Binatia bacterium]
MAEQTGGFAVVNVNDFASEFKRIEAETATTTSGAARRRSGPPASRSAARQSRCDARA